MVLEKLPINKKTNPKKADFNHLLNVEVYSIIGRRKKVFETTGFSKNNSDFLAVLVY